MFLELFRRSRYLPAFLDYFPQFFLPTRAAFENDMPLVLCSIILRFLPKVQRGKAELFPDLVRHIFQPRIISVVKMQFLSRNRVDGIDHDMTVNGLRIRVRGYDALAAFKHLFRTSLCILLRHERISFIGLFRFTVFFSIIFSSKVFCVSAKGIRGKHFP